MGITASYLVKILYIHRHNLSSITPWTSDRRHRYAQNEWVKSTCSYKLKSWVSYHLSQVPQCHSERALWNSGVSRNLLSEDSGEEEIGQVIGFYFDLWVEDLIDDFGILKQSNLGVSHYIRISTNNTRHPWNANPRRDGAQMQDSLEDSQWPTFSPI